MVVILIMSILIVLGNYWVFTQRREKARIEELAVQIIWLIDQEKTNALLGKTEGGAIVRKRKIDINFNSWTSTLSYIAHADLAQDIEGTYSVTSTPTKNWQFFDPSLTASFYNCDSGTAALLPGTTWLTIELTWDTLNFTTPSGVKHIVLMVSRDTVYWEIHMDKRTGVTYEREKDLTGSVPSCT